ncbi:hypothetical protein ABMA27_011030 [Loxostege sticticalis]|uniref:Uncharacterized protein n=1 Tax=Loxostege sticticalis TaxID=481309 RepID=A0ABR3H339_LOXSC
MENIKQTDKDSGVLRPFNNAATFTLHSLCCKVIFMQEKDLKKEENMFNGINEDNMNSTYTNILSSGLGPDLDEQLNFGPEMINTDFLTENLNLDNNTQDWMNLNEFDNFIHELKVVDPSSLVNEFSGFAESYIGHQNDYKELTNVDIGIFGKTRVDGAQTKAKTFQDDFIAYSRVKLAIDSPKKNNSFVNKTHTADNDMIIISSSDDSDLELSLPDDIDTISLSSIEAFENMIQNDKKSKITIEISPRIEYVTNFNAKADTIDTKEKLGAISLSSSSFNSITDTNDTKKYEDLNDSFCSGYNSSDFEFITEEEAKTDGLIINYKKNKRITSHETCHTVEVSAFNTPECNQMPSSSNNTEDYRQNHQIPVGENYFDLFRGLYEPTVPLMYENKSMGLLMNEYAGLGFDIGVLRRQIREYQPDDEYKEEADECAKRILKMYPNENRKRRRRFI